MLKRTLSLILAALFVIAAVGTALAEPSAPDAADLFNDNAPYRAEGGEIVVTGETFAGEIISCLKDPAGAVVRGFGGEALASPDRVKPGMRLEVGDFSATVVRAGDIDGDSKIGARDVIAAMRAMIDPESSVSRAADVDRDGSVNAKDVIKLMKYLTGWDVSLAEPAPEAANEDASLGMYFASAMERIAREDTAVHGDPTGVIYVAKNEIEDAHILVTAAETKEGLTLDVGEIKNAAGDVLDREVRYGYYYSNVMWNDLSFSRDYSNHTGGYWADPYPELRSAFDIKENESQSFIIKVKTKADTAAGWYSAPICVLDSAGNEVKRTVLRVLVWNFAIDDHDLSYTTFDTYSQGLAGWFGKQVDTKYFNGAVWQPWYKKWYDYILENKMNTAQLPYELDDERVNEYLDDPRVTSFITQTGKDADCWDDPNTAPTLRAKYEKLKQKQEWLDKAYIYTVDEPWDQRGANWIMKQWNSAKEALGDIPFQTIVPYYNSWQADLDMDLTEQLWDYCNVFCPDAVCFNPAVTKRERIKNRDKYPDWWRYYEDAQVEKYGEFAPRYEAMRERGDKMWWYICVTPVYPAANFFITYQGAWTRVVFWQQYNVHADGFLYWSMIMWNMGEHDPRYINLKRVNGGDGLLVYPGTFWYGDDEPMLVPSIRFEMIRDGFEDYAYMRQLERFIGRDATLAGYCDRCTTGTTQFTEDWHDIDAVRNEMGWTLVDLNAN